ncbi:Spc98 family-domain-containing protein [Xylariomycetidae sp. FL0641]|nr:Spc98 family-domain-containing protein [Xylariomycetidae sp. FL0641]
MSGASADRSRRINLSIDRLITQILPQDPHLSDDEKAQRHAQFVQEVKQQLQSPHQPPLDDQNHASELIRRRLVQTNPSQALRFSNLYSRLLALPVLNQKWAMLYLLHQLTDSPDPDEPDPMAFHEFNRERREEARRRKQREKELDEAEFVSMPSDDDDDDSGSVDGGGHITAGAPGATARRRDPPVDDQYRPTELRDVLKDPRDKMVLDGESLSYPKRTRANTLQTQAQAQAQTQNPLKRDVAIKSKRLADNYAEINPTEPALLRDLPYTLQGLSSTTLPFGKGYTLKLPSTLPVPIVGILHTLAEPSLLYRSLEDFVKTPTRGLVDQSLRAAIKSELRSYLTLVATLEGQIRQALSVIDENAPRNGIGKAGVTLKRCVVWTREATMGLRMLSVIAEESRTKHGGQIISLIHSFSTSHGDPMVGAFAERLLTPVTRPFYDILRYWIYDGELSDPYSEFFVQLKPEEEAPKGRTGSINVWQDKYQLAEPMVPSIITTAFADKVVLIGKSLNFIRNSCGDAQWVESYSKETSKELRYGDTATLEAWIDDAYRTTMRRLMHLMITKFHIYDHLQGLKDYILLGQGDFIALLMESLAANLDRPAGAQYRHTLTAQLEHAIRGSNAQYDSQEVLRRLDARMLQLSHGDIGWDCFTLEYKIDAPVDVVVSDWGNRQYLKVFNFLWRIKRVEFALSSVWRQVTTGSRGVLQTDNPAVQQAWKTTRGHLAEMVHFVGQLQYYILFEVIESSWTELQARLSREQVTLDDVIDAHTNYLKSITHKGLLGARRRHYTSASASNAAPANEDDENGYMVQLGELLRIMLAYRDCVDGLYSWSVSDFTQRQEAELLHKPVRPTSTAAAAAAFHRRGAASTASSIGTDTRMDIDDTPTPTTAVPQSEFPALTDRLRHLGDRFRTKLQLLFGDLASQPDVDLRFLGVAMNFNDHYKATRHRARGTPGTLSTASASINVAEKEKR